MVSSKKKKKKPEKKVPKKIGFFKKIFKKTNLIGLDIGTQNIKLVQIRFVKDKYFIIKADREIIEKDLSKEMSPLERRELTITALNRLIIRNNIKSGRIATSISGNSVIARFVHFPKMSEAELSKSIEYEAEPFIPFDINEVELAFEIFKEVVEDEKPKMETLLVAAKRAIIDEKIDIIKATGLRPLVIDIDAFAFDHIIEIMKSSENETVMCVNIGAFVTNMIIIEKNVAKVIRDITVGGNDFTNALRLSSSMDYLEAEKEKTSQDSSDNASLNSEQNSHEEKEAQVQDEDKFDEVYIPPARVLVDEIQRSINYFQAQTGEINVSRIYISGGGALLKNLDKYLMSELDIPIEIFDPFNFFEIMKGKKISPQIKELGSLFTVALGLATRKM